MKLNIGKSQHSQLNTQLMTHISKNNNDSWERSPCLHPLNTLVFVWMWDISKVSSWMFSCRAGFFLCLDLCRHLAKPPLLQAG